MTKKTIILTHPRSGSHLLAHILKAVPFTAIKHDGNYVTVNKVINQIVYNKRNFWFHYPFNSDLVDALKRNHDYRVLLLRDPRDIICSIADIVDDNQVLDNRYTHDGKRLSAHPFSKRIDILIETMRADFDEYEKWRRSGLWFVLRYRDIISFHAARYFRKHKRNGVAGSHKAIMKPKQIERANYLYKDLIAAW